MKLGGMATSATGKFRDPDYRKRRKKQTKYGRRSGNVQGAPAPLDLATPSGEIGRKEQPGGLAQVLNILKQANSLAGRDKKSTEEPAVQPTRGPAEASRQPSSPDTVATAPEVTGPRRQFEQVQAALAGRGGGGNGEQAAIPGSSETLGSDWRAARPSKYMVGPEGEPFTPNPRHTDWRTKLLTNLQAFRKEAQDKHRRQARTAIRGGTPKERIALRNLVGRLREAQMQQAGATERTGMTGATARDVAATRAGATRYGHDVRAESRTDVAEIRAGAKKDTALDKITKELRRAQEAASKRERQVAQKENKQILKDIKRSAGVDKKAKTAAATVATKIERADNEIERLELQVGQFEEDYAGDPQLGQDHEYQMVQLRLRHAQERKAALQGNLNETFDRATTVVAEVPPAGDTPLETAAINALSEDLQDGKSFRQLGTNWSKLSVATKREFAQWADRNGLLR